MNERRQWVRPLIYSIVGIAVGAFIVLMAWIVVTILQVANEVKEVADNTDDTTTQIRETQKGSRALLDLIKDCTEPEGTCYQESEARSAEQAGAYNAALIAAAWCVKQDPDTRHELTVCVGKILDGKKGHKQ